MVTMVAMRPHRDPPGEIVRKRYNKLTEALDAIKSVQGGEIQDSIFGPDVAARLAEARGALDVACQEIERRRLRGEW